MAHPIAPDYGQQFLFPPALEDWIPGDHPARFLREFVDQLNLPELGFVMPAAVAGRPPYAPSLLLKIWLYGYYHRIRGTRPLENACREHLSLLWLTGLLAPDHNSLWRFWRDNKQPLRAIFKQSVHLALQSGCVGLVLQAVDGTKIEAAAGNDSGWSKEYMEKLMAALDTALAEMEVKIAAEQPASDSAGPRLPAGLAERQALREKIKAGLAQLAADGREHYQPVEPEARRMKISGRNRFGYNAQAVSDSQAGIIVACAVTRHENDGGQLGPMIQAAQENTGGASAQSLTVADAGYGAGADIKAAADEQRNVLVPPAEGTGKDHSYASQYFQYDEVRQSVHCPRGVQLDHEGGTTKNGVRVERYRCHCRDCPVRAQCTRDPKGRGLEVWPHTPQVQAMRARLRDPAVYAQWSQRKEIIERRFGQIKQHDGFRRWTVWGLESVRTQWSLLCATLNLRILYQQWRAGPEAKPTSAAATGKQAATPKDYILSKNPAPSDLKSALPWTPPLRIFAQQLHGYVLDPARVLFRRDRIVRSPAAVMFN